MINFSGWNVPPRSLDLWYDSWSWPGSGQVLHSPWGGCPQWTKTCEVNITRSSPVWPGTCSDSSRVSQLSLGLSETRTVSCLSQRVYPRPVHVWSAGQGVSLTEDKLSLTMWPSSHLVTARSRVNITGLVSNNNSRVTCTATQYSRWLASHWLGLTSLSTKGRGTDGERHGPALHQCCGKQPVRQGTGISSPSIGFHSRPIFGSGAPHR